MLRNVREVNRVAMDIVKNEKSLSVLLDKLYELEKSLKGYIVIILEGFDLGFEKEYHNNDYLWICNTNTDREIITDVTNILNTKD